MSKNVNIKITADSSSVEKSAQKAKSSIESVGKSASSAGSGFKGFLNGGLIGAGFAVAKAGIDAMASSLDGAIRRFDTMNNFPKMMSNLGISSTEAEKSIAVLSDKLVGLPTTLDDAVSTVQRLTAVNNDLKGSTGAFLAINNAILAGNAPMEQQRTALEQISQAYAKGKPDMMEWRAMMSAMPAQLSQVAKSMGLANPQELQAGLIKGKISMNDFINEIIKLNNQGLPGFQSFEQQARNSTGGVATSMANLRNAIVRLVAGIMDAIGQANISGFIQGISKAITGAIPYIQAFIRIISMAISAVVSLFGGGAKKAQEVSKAMSASAQSAGSAGLAGGAQQADKALGGASKKAKELKKQLAGFDEMKVLQEPTTDSGSGGGKGGSGGGGGGSIMGVDDLFGDTNKIGDKVDEIVKSILEKFKGVNFEPLLNSFKVLGDGISNVWENLIKPVATLIFTEFLEPLSKYVIEDTLPRWFTGIGNILKGLDFKPLTDGLVPALQGIAEASKVVLDFGTRVFEKFIVPVSTVAINESLKILGNALTIIGEALKFLAGVYESAKPVLDWILGLAANFVIGAIEGFSGVLNGIADALKAIAENEVVKSILDGIGQALNEVGKALGVIAENEVVKEIITALNEAFSIMGGTLGVVAGAIAILTGAFTLASIAGTAFGVVMAVITSPITIIIGIIAAIITVIVLLIKHWDSIVGVVVNVWNSVMNTLKPIGDWIYNTIIKPVVDFFKTSWDIIYKVVETAVLLVVAILATIAEFVWKNVVQPVANFFKGCWDGISAGLKGAWDFMSGIFRGIANFVNGVVIQPVVGFFRGLFNTVSQIFNTVANAVKSVFEGIGKTIGQVVGGVAGIVKAPINGIIGLVNNVIGTLNKIKVPDWVPVLGGKGINIPKIPMLARGGVVNRATLAVVGEAGKEAVMPLENNTGWIDKLAGQIAEKNGGGNSNNQPIMLNVQIGDETIYSKVIEGINNQTFMSGESQIFI